MSDEASQAQLDAIQQAANPPHPLGGLTTEQALLRMLYDVHREFMLHLNSALNRERAELTIRAIREFRPDGVSPELE